MTIAVKINNLSEDRTIQIVSISYNKERGDKTEQVFQNVPPGGAQTVYVHLLMDIKIRELEP